MLARIALILTILLFMLGFVRAQDKPPATSYLYLGTAIDWKVGALSNEYVYTDQQGRAWNVRLRAQRSSKMLKMTVSAEGFKPASTSFDLDGSADYGTLGVYDFDAGQPSFVLTNYSMGAHCCTDVKAIVFNGQKLAATDAGSYDGGGITVRDVDGDGTFELETTDQRFLYAFDSYAGSLAARKLAKIRQTGVEDVTDSPDYQNYLVSEVGKWADLCYNNPAPGVCAGALGTAAKAGLYQSVAASVDFKKIDADNRDAGYLTCSAAQCGVDMKFWNYREALEFQLNDWGYNTDSSMTDRSRAFFRRLAAFPKGFGSTGEANAAACREDAVHVAMDKDGRFATINGNEYGCRIEKATVLNNTAVGLGLCAGEGESYSTLLVMELEKDRLYLNWLYKGAVNSTIEPEALDACR